MFEFTGFNFNSHLKANIFIGYFFIIQMLADHSLSVYETPKSQLGPLLQNSLIGPVTTASTITDSSNFQFLPLDGL